MISYLARRAASSVATMFVIAALIFIATFAVGDPVQVLAPPDATAADLDHMRVTLGLDKPMAEQFVRFIRNVATGNLGDSFVFRRPVTELMAERLPATLELALLAFVIAVAVGIPLGMYAGARPESRSARAIMSLSLFGVSLPSFWIGILLMLCFGVWLGWFPTGGRGETVRVLGMQLSVFTFDGLAHILLPALNLALFKIALVIRLTRAGVREILPLDYIRFAQCKGLAPSRIYGLHVLKNLMIPVVTVLGIELGNLIAYTTIVETIFSWPGVGKLLIDSINMVDRPVIVMYTLFAIATFLVLNLIVDLVYVALDPRVRLPGAEATA
jgi:peptide/nickel transport system permease protein